MKLKRYVDQFGTNSWNRICKLLPGKSEIKCHTRWLALTNCQNFVMGTWTQKEDKILTESVKKHGARDWTKISQ